MGLSLRRKRGESILIGNDVRITITRCKNTHTVLECEAPPNVKIMREELYLSMKEQAIGSQRAEPSSLAKVVAQSKSARHALTGE